MERTVFISAIYAVVALAAGIATARASQDPHGYAYGGDADGGDYCGDFGEGETIQGQEVFFLSYWTDPEDAAWWLEDEDEYKDPERVRGAYVTGSGARAVNNAARMLAPNFTAYPDDDYDYELDMALSILNGGYSKNGLATGNLVQATGGLATYAIWGGQSDADAGSGGSCGNRVEMTCAAYSPRVVGGIARGDANANSIDYIPCSNVGWITGEPNVMYGGQSWGGGSVVGNRVDFGGNPSTLGPPRGACFANEVIGGYDSCLELTERQVTGNMVEVWTGQIGCVIGGKSLARNADENIVVMHGGTVDSAIGGQGVNAATNRVIVLNAQSQDPMKQTIVQGGSASLENSGHAYGNEVLLVGLDAEARWTGPYYTAPSSGQFVGSLVEQNQFSGGTAFSIDEAYGGRGAYAEGNTVAILGSGVTVVNVIGGWSSSEGQPAGYSFDNRVLMDNGKVTGGIYGGSAMYAAKDNHVTMSAGEAALICGGFSWGTGVDSTADRNAVIVESGNVGAINGGKSDYANADNNTVVVTGGIVTGEINGGSATMGTASDNAVFLEGISFGLTLKDADGQDAPCAEATFTVGNVYGGQGFSAIGNSVTTDGNGTARAIYGGAATRPVADHNPALSDVSTEEIDCNAENNSVLFHGGTADEIVGGQASGGNATGNLVIVTGGGSGGMKVTGGRSYDGAAKANRVYILGGTMQEVYGGSCMATSGDAGVAYDNEVHLVGNGASITLDGDTYQGGASVILNGAYGADATSLLNCNNSIDIYGNRITAGAIGFMQILNFHLVDGLTSPDAAPMVTLTGDSDNQKLDLTGVELSFDALDAMDWQPGESVTLVSSKQDFVLPPGLLGTTYDIKLKDTETLVASATLEQEITGEGIHLLKMTVSGSIPEPATGTLSLLALCALAARRHRRK